MHFHLVHVNYIILGIACLVLLVFYGKNGSSWHWHAPTKDPPALRVYVDLYSLFAWLLMRHLQP